MAMSVSVSAWIRAWRVVNGGREAMSLGAESGGTWLLWTDWTRNEGREGADKEEGDEDEDVIASLSWMDRE
jgi:hypothetical protein